MLGMRLYIPIEEFSEFIKEKMKYANYNGRDVLEDTEDCTFVPLKMELNEVSMDIEAWVVPVKNGEPFNCRFHV